MNKKDIFEGAKFGDKFLTRDGRVAIFKSHHNTMARLSAHYVKMWIENNDGCLLWHYDGTAHDDHTHLDIVSRYHEPIDEDKLNKLATKWGLDFINSHTNMNVSIEGDTILDIDITKAYKAGYNDRVKEE